ncbi:DMT family transporter [Streptomyces sp. NPDC047017]|uniref:DMT family transporter n=1 Tax=Streptomyces sp. NPDC047017 TaxID=3155024 RepID=UPI0033DEA4FF
MIGLAVLFAVLGAASNAVGTAFQRKAASAVPSGGGLRLLLALARHPVWLAGICGVVASAMFQALALVNGPMALVQPLFIMELPFALLIAGVLMRRGLPGPGWWAVAGVVAGLVLVLVSAAPSGSHDQAPMVRWVPALFLGLGLMGAAVVLARPGRPPLFRAAVLAGAAAIGNALTAAMLKSASGILDADGFPAFLATWQTYGFAVLGISSLLLLENALQAGSLAASQPALTIGDATVSLVLGVMLFGEHVRLGVWLLPELAGAGLIVWGVLRLIRVVPHAQETLVGDGGPDEDGAGGSGTGGEGDTAGSRAGGGARGRPPRMR